MSLRMETRAFILRCVQRELINAEDDFARAKMQHARFPLDEANNADLDRYRVRVTEARLAIEAVNRL